MTIVDLTHTIKETMPLWPGTPAVRLEPLSTIEENGSQETMLHCSTHSGTHVEAPAHLLAGGVSLDTLNPNQFAGQGIVLDCRNRKTISLAMLQSYAADLNRVEYVLFYTGSGRNWLSSAYYEEYPVLSEDAARYLASLQLKGVGIDAISFDEFTDGDLPIHKILMRSGKLLMENLRNLKNLIGKDFLLVAAPLKILNAEAAPARVFAVL